MNLIARILTAILAATASAHPNRFHLDDDDHRLYHVPKNREGKETVPYVFVLSSTIQETPSHRPLLVLCDSGATTSWINNDALPPGTTPTIIESIKGLTVAGEFHSNREVTIRDVVLPELHQDRILSDLQVRVFDAPCRYDVILGRDALRHFELVLDFEFEQITTTTSSIPMRSFPNDFTTPSDLARQLYDEATTFEAPTSIPTGFDSIAFDDYVECSSPSLQSEWGGCEASYEEKLAVEQVRTWTHEGKANWWSTLLPDFAGNRGVAYLITTAVVLDYLHVLRRGNY